MNARNRWITLDYLEIFCEQHQLMIGCESADNQLWISPLGPHPSSLTASEVHQILTDSALFEVRAMSDDDEEAEAPFFLTRAELEQRIKRMLN
ncbi:MAG TPA: hypothetical protein PLP42_09045 [Acidobacteriota bacterium]|nr:hypothetical protein [Acidobacteriota bacterium]